MRVPDRFRPLPEVIFYDDFDTGLNGWILEIVESFPSSTRRSRSGFAMRKTVIRAALMPNHALEPKKPKSSRFFR